jgi:hypothetical protein
LVYCAYEQGEFDEDEFESTEEWGLVHTRTPRHTTLGDLIEEGTIPAPDVEADEL